MAPTPERRRDQNIEKSNSAMGFPGCLGAVDCVSWSWENCPVAWQGQFKGKDKKPSIRLEVVCDDKLRIWHLKFGTPGAKNYVSIVNASSLFNAIRSCSWPPVRPETCVAGLNLNWFYYLADGIYPNFRIFAKSLKLEFSRNRGLQKRNYILDTNPPR